MVDQAGAYAYNSWWQFRADSWSRLEEAAARIISSLRRGKPIDQHMTEAVHDAMRGTGAAGAVLGVSRPRSLRCRPGAGSWPEAGNGWHGWWLGSTARSSRSPTARGSLDDIALGRASRRQRGDAHRHLA